MSGYSHLTAEERDRLADLKADGVSLRAIAPAFGRAASTISRELRRNALDSGAYSRTVGIHSRGSQMPRAADYHAAQGGGRIEASDEGNGCSMT